MHPIILYPIIPYNTVYPIIPYNTVWSMQKQSGTTSTSLTVSAHVSVSVGLLSAVLRYMRTRSVSEHPAVFFPAEINKHFTRNNGRTNAAIIF